MEVTLAEVFAANEPLSKLVAMRLPVKVSLFIARLAKEMFEEIALIDAERRKLVEKYGKPNDNGEISVSPLDRVNYSAFIKDFNELLSQETEIKAAKVLLPIEVDGKPLQIEPSILMALSKFIEVE